jgi:hypothetical protein
MKVQFLNGVAGGTPLTGWVLTDGGLKRYALQAGELKAKNQRSKTKDQRSKTKDQSAK